MKIENNFDSWNKKKKKIDNQQTQVFFKERDIFYVALGKNIGFEQDGKQVDFVRPVIVLRKFNNNVFLCVPLTTKIKNNQFHFKFIFGNKENRAILSQVRLLDAKRLINKKGVISKSDFNNLKRKISKLLKFTDFS